MVSEDIFNGLCALRANPIIYPQVRAYLISSAEACKQLVIDPKVTNDEKMLAFLQGQHHAFNTLFNLLENELNIVKQQRDQEQEQAMSQTRS